MSLLRCQWCGAVAQTRVKARTPGGGATVEILYCGPETTCWEKTYKIARKHSYQDWTAVERGEPDLFDLLPDKGARPA